MHISSTVYKWKQSKFQNRFKVPLLWVMKGLSWESPTTGWLACKVKKHFHCLIICMFLPYLLNDSFFQTPPLRHVNLQWLVRLVSFSSHHACKAWLSSICERSAALCTALPRHLVSKKKFVVSFRPTRKDQQVGGQYANVSCWRQHETAWDLFLKMTRFNDSTLSLRYNNCTIQ